MEIIYCPDVLTHNKHEIIEESSYRLDLLEKIGKIRNIDFDVIPYLRKVHPMRYIRKIKGYCESKVPLAEIKTSPETFNAALSSIGLSILASRNLNFAVTRPPGHHAQKERAKGFCLFNNIAVATYNLVDFGSKVCIIDIDGHHGDGTEKIFYHNNNVLFCSIHQEHSYPYNTGFITDIGLGEGRGFNMNIIVPKGSGDDILINSLDFLKGYVDKFKPDVIGISAGFDGYQTDRLLQLRYTLHGYHRAGKEISNWGYPLFAVLEGGYHDKVVECIDALVCGINSKKNIFIEKMSLSNKGIHHKLKKNLLRLEGKLNENPFL